MTVQITISLVITFVYNCMVIGKALQYYASTHLAVYLSLENLFPIDNLSA